jgi:hypothetical protein
MTERISVSLGDLQRVVFEVRILHFLARSWQCRTKRILVLRDDKEFFLECKMLISL